MYKDSSASEVITRTDIFRFLEKFRVEAGLIALNLYLAGVFTYTLVYKFSTYRNIFESMNVELSFSTDVILSLSQTLNDMWPLTMALIAVCLSVTGYFVYTVSKAIIMFEKKQMNKELSIVKVISFYTLCSTAISILVLQSLMEEAAFASFSMLINSCG